MVDFPVAPAIIDAPLPDGSKEVKVVTEERENQAASILSALMDEGRFSGR